MSKVDLHIHTNASDGRFSPEEIVKISVDRGLEFIAITDHDTIDGVAPALEAGKAFPGITVIPGVEINTDVPSGEVHILGYFIDCKDSELRSVLERLRHSRVIRAQKMVEKLRKMGVQIDFERVQQIAGRGALGRPHVAQALLEKGYIYNFREAFLKYIGRGCPAYVEREKVTPLEAVQMVKEAHGLPVLAHPFTFDNAEDTIIELKAGGLVGIEVYYDSYTPDQTELLLRLSNTYQLIPTGGSDFHGIESAREIWPGAIEVPLESALRLLALSLQ